MARRAPSHDGPVFTSLNRAFGIMVKYARDPDNTSKSAKVCPRSDLMLRKIVSFAVWRKANDSRIYYA